jgi:hypothetical protein
MIDLDAADVGSGIASVDLADVATLRANRGRYRDSDSDDLNVERSQGTRRATRDWKFPSMDTVPNSAPATEIPNRRTLDWTMPLAETSNTGVPDRRTRDWTFPSIAPSKPPEPAYGNDDSDDGFSEPSLRPRPALRHAATQPISAFDNQMYAQGGGPDSPKRSSMIDLDFADPDQRGSMIDLDFADPDSVRRPSTSSSSHSVSTSGNPFEYEDGLHRDSGDSDLKPSFSSSSISSQDPTLLSAPGSNRQSFHIKSQSEPQHNLSGLLTPGQRTSAGHLSKHSYDSRSRSGTISSDADNDYAADAEGENDLTIRGHDQKSHQWPKEALQDEYANGPRHQRQSRHFAQPSTGSDFDTIDDSAWLRYDAEFDEVMSQLPPAMLRPGDVSWFPHEEVSRYEELATRLHLDAEPGVNGNGDAKAEDEKLEAQREYTDFLEEIGAEVGRNLVGFLRWGQQGRREAIARREEVLKEGLKEQGVGNTAFDDGDDDGLIDLDA